MAINVNELLLDRVRSVRFRDLEDGTVIGRLTQLEDASLQTAAEAEEITDAVGALIAKIFRAKTGRFEATNSLFSIDLATLQYGSEKVLGASGSAITVPCEEILTIASGKVTLSHTPSNTIKYIYAFANNDISTKYEVATTASATEFAISGTEITVPTGLTGKVYVEYEYASEEAISVTNYADKFPEVVGVVISAKFKDKCNPNIKYYGSIIARKGQIDPSSIDISLTSTGKHSFAIDFLKDYCDEDGELFKIVIDEDEDTQGE